MLILPKSKSIAHFIFSEKAFPIAQKVHPKATSSALNDICYAYINKKDYISALKICNEAIACEKVQLTDITITLSKE